MRGEYKAPGAMLLLGSANLTNSLGKLKRVASSATQQLA